MALRIAIGIVILAGVALIVWRLQFQKKMDATEKQVIALLASADQLIVEQREDEAEAAMRKALGMQPGDVRCQAMIDRIETKRAMIHRKKSSEAHFSLERADQVALSDVKGAVAILEAIRKDSSFTPEAQATALARLKEIADGNCTLHLPANWPANAELTIDDMTKKPKKGILKGIVHGERTIQVTRYGYRSPAAIKLDFKGTEPVQLPAIDWRLLGAKVYVASKPAGAAVWKDGKDTGKVTPCEFNDVDDGPIEFVLKHRGRSETSVKGEVKDRQPMKLSATLQP